MRIAITRWYCSEDAEITMNNKRGAVNAGELIGIVIAIAISVIMISTMFPPSLDTFYDEDTDGWGFGEYNETSGEWESGEEDTKTTTIWEMLPMMGAVCALLLFVGIIVKMLK